MPITKVIAANDTVNGAAYINPNSLKIPSTLQTVSNPSGISDPVYQGQSVVFPSSVLQDRFRLTDLKDTDVNIVSVSGVKITNNDIK